MKIGMIRNGDKIFPVASSEKLYVDASKFGSWKSAREIIADWDNCADILRSAIADQGQLFDDSLQWTAPIPDPPKFLLLAGNYRAHVVESGFAELPADNMTPQFFIKPNTTIAGPSDTLPLTARNHSFDYEAELAVVIGKRMKNASIKDAQGAIWGYTVVNDVSERKLNAAFEGRKLRSNDEFFDWLTGKWFDGSTPMGPYVVSADEIADPSQLIVKAFLNGQCVQEAPASAMVHSVGEALSYISRIVTLEIGDVVSMGTPAGVGMARHRLLQPGDLIECQIEGIGRLANRITAS